MILPRNKVVFPCHAVRGATRVLARCRQQLGAAPAKRPGNQESSVRASPAATAINQSSPASPARQQQRLDCQHRSFEGNRSGAVVSLGLPVPHRRLHTPEHTSPRTPDHTEHGCLSLCWKICRERRRVGRPEICSTTVYHEQYQHRQIVQLSSPVINTCMQRLCTQRGLSRVGHSGLLSTNSWPDQPAATISDLFIIFINFFKKCNTGRTWKRSYCLFKGCRRQISKAQGAEWLAQGPTDLPQNEGPLADSFASCTA